MASDEPKIVPRDREKSRRRREVPSKNVTRRISRLKIIEQVRADASLGIVAIATLPVTICRREFNKTPGQIRGERRNSRDTERRGYGIPETWSRRLPTRNLKVTPPIDSLVLLSFSSPLDSEGASVDVQRLWIEHRQKESER